MVVKRVRKVGERQFIEVFNPKTVRSVSEGFDPLLKEIPGPAELAERRDATAVFNEKTGYVFPGSWVVSQMEPSANPGLVEEWGGILASDDLSKVNYDSLPRGDLRPLLSGVYNHLRAKGKTAIRADSFGLFVDWVCDGLTANELARSEAGRRSLVPDKISRSLELLVGCGVDRRLIRDLRYMGLGLRETPLDSRFGGERPLKSMVSTTVRAFGLFGGEEGRISDDILGIWTKRGFISPTIFNPDRVKRYAVGDAHFGRFYLRMRDRLKPVKHQWFDCGFDWLFEGKTLQEVADKYGISKNHTRQNVGFTEKMLCSREYVVGAFPGEKVKPITPEDFANLRVAGMKNRSTPLDYDGLVKSMRSYSLEAIGSPKTLADEIYAHWTKRGLVEKR